jgi:S-adenosylmethionine decarboxylase
MGVAKLKGFLYFCDLVGCRKILAGDELREAAIKAVRRAGMQEVQRLYGHFPEHKHKTEYGDSVVTLIIPLEQSHLAIHTWPHHKLVSIDLFTCGERNDARIALNYLIDLFKPEKRKVYGFRRGY